MLRLGIRGGRRRQAEVMKAVIVDRMSSRLAFQRVLFGFLVAAMAARLTIAENRFGSQGTLPRKKYHGNIRVMLTVITHAGGRVDFRGNPGAEPEFPVGSRSITSRRALRNRAALTVLRQQRLDGRHPE